MTQLPKDIFLRMNSCHQATMAVLNHIYISINIILKKKTFYKVLVSWHHDKNNGVHTLGKVSETHVLVQFTFQVTLMLWDDVGSRWTSWGGPSGAVGTKTHRQVIHTRGRFFSFVRKQAEKDQPWSRYPQNGIKFICNICPCLCVLWNIFRRLRTPNGTLKQF